MNVIEYIEEKHQLVRSKEVQDYINDLKEVEGYILPYMYEDLTILKGCGKCMVFTSIEYPNTCDWVELNSGFVTIYTHHFFSRYRKRRPFYNHLNVRCNPMDKLLSVIHVLWNLKAYLTIPGEDIEGFLNTENQAFYLCEDGIIPVTFLSPTIIRCNTFISSDLLSKEQGEFWYNAYKDLSNQNK